MTHDRDSLGWLAVVAIALAAPFLGVMALSHCGAGDKMTPEDHALTWTESAQDVQCVRDYRGDAGTVRKCRAGVKADWDAYWRAHFADGGAE